MIRRGVLAILPVVAALALSSCSTFDHQDAVATVNGQELSRTELSDLLHNTVVQNALTGALDDDRASLGGQADQIIGIWISLQVADQSGLVDFAGGSASASADLTTQYHDDFAKAPAKVQQLLTQLQTYHAQLGAADDAKLYAAVQQAKVHVDSRYGFWDAAQASVLPFGEST